MKRKDKIQFGLDENRILVLGAELVLGFQFPSIFENGYEHLSRVAQLLAWGGLVALVIALGLLIAPASFHRIVERGHDSLGFDRVLTALMFPALLPFVLGLSSDFLIVGERLGGRSWALARA